MSNINPPKTPRPRTIGRFELLAWLWFVLTVCYIVGYVILDLDEILSANDDPTVLEAAIGIFFMASLLIRPVLIFAAARRRQNWARWFFAILVAIDVAMTPAAALLPSYVFTWTDLVISVLCFIVEIAAVYFAFSRESAVWFSRPAPDPAIA